MAKKSKPNLVRQVAMIVDPTGFACSPEMYGFTTVHELRRQTFAGSAQKVAEYKARKIIRMLKREC